MGNTTNVDGIEVYEHEIYRLADEFIDKELNGDSDAVHNNFLRMIFYIADRIQKSPNDDIELLDGIFEIYVRLCVRYQVLPTLECFSFLVKINRTTFTDWKAGEYRKDGAHAVTVKRWFDIYKSFAVERLHNAGKVDVNLIFVCKAAYQMREAAPEMIESSNNDMLRLNREEIAARYEAFKERPEPLELDD